MSLFGKNIRKIRTIKQLTQTQFAELFSITRASTGAYEEGRAEPKTELVSAVAKYFSISLDGLLTRQLTVNEILNFGNSATSIPSKGNAVFVPKDMREKYHKTIIENLSFEEFPTSDLPWTGEGNFFVFETDEQDFQNTNRGLFIVAENADLSRIRLNHTYITIIDNKFETIKSVSISPEKIFEITSSKQKEKSNFFVVILEPVYRFDEF